MTYLIHRGRIFGGKRRNWELAVLTIFSIWEEEEKGSEAVLLRAFAILHYDRQSICTMSSVHTRKIKQIDY
jgi:hypothetical protein